MNYQINKAKARIFNKGKPSLTDQSQAKDTDINVIVGRFIKTGAATAAPNAPMNGDFSNLPRDLRGIIEESRKLQQLRHKLPKELRDKPVEELLTLSPTELTSILTPPATSPAPKEEPKT